MNYYNENDPFAAEWLRNLIKEGLISLGEVDERSIKEVQPEDLKDFKQCHFFAGIGVWSYALRKAGWSDDTAVWTGSCPCQPFSIASVAHGGAKGQEDARHLWPDWFGLVRKSRPRVIFGEQVKNAIRWGWLDEVSRDLESEGYSFASFVLAANMFGADHERKRILFVADSSRKGWAGYQSIERLSKSTKASFSKFGDNFSRARRVMDHDYNALLPCDGTSVVMERSALKGYGNAICAPQAQAFIEAFMETKS